VYQWRTSLKQGSKEKSFRIILLFIIISIAGSRYVAKRTNKTNKQSIYLKTNLSRRKNHAPEKGTITSE